MPCARVFSCPFVSFAGFPFLSPREFSPCPCLAGPNHERERRAAVLVCFGLDPSQGTRGARAPSRGFLLSRPARDLRAARYCARRLTEVGRPHQAPGRISVKTPLIYTEG